MEDGSYIKTEIYHHMLKRLLPLPIVRRSFKLRLYCEQVSSQRLRVLPDEVTDIVYIGSQHEGLSVTTTSIDGGDAFVSKSDYDAMPVLRRYQAIDPGCNRRYPESIETLTADKSSLESTNPLELLEIHEASHAGYCKLKSLRTGNFVGLRFDEDGSGKINIFHDGNLTGSLTIPYKQLIIPGLYEDNNAELVEVIAYVHGPAISCTKIQVHPGSITQTGAEVDVVLSIKCQTWPVVADGFLSRIEGCGWPSKEVRDNLKLENCYVVAVAPALSPNPQQEWRYSFASVEKVLARSFTYAQRGSYILTKMLFKTALVGIDKVSSYCLKTQMFWFCESEGSRVLRYNTIGLYALQLLSELADNLATGVVKNYIIPENNMVDHVPQAILIEASRKLKEVVRNPVPVMKTIRQSTKYFGSITHPNEKAFEPLAAWFDINI